MSEESIALIIMHITSVAIGALFVVGTKICMREWRNKRWAPFVAFIVWMLALTAILVWNITNIMGSP